MTGRAGQGAGAADTIVLRGERCVLRAFRPDELDALLAARFADDPDAFAGPREHGARPREALRRRIAASGRVHQDHLELAIEADGALAGDIQGRSGRRMLPPGVWELGIELYGAAARGRGLGTEATRLFVSHLFTGQGAERVQATTDVTNAAMRKVLANLGFAEEGVLRGFMPGRDGGGPRHDYVMAAVTRGAWPFPR